MSLKSIGKKAKKRSLLGGKKDFSIKNVSKKESVLKNKKEGEQEEELKQLEVQNPKPNDQKHSDNEQKHSVDEQNHSVDDKKHSVDEQKHSVDEQKHSVDDKKHSVDEQKHSVDDKKHSVDPIVTDDEESNSDAQGESSNARYNLRSQVKYFSLNTSFP